MLIQKKQLDNRQKFVQLDSFYSSTKSVHGDSQKILNLLYHQNKLSRLIQNILKEYNIEIFNYSNIEVFDSTSPVICLSKFNDPLKVKPVLKRIMITNQFDEMNGIFLNKEGQCFQSIRNNYSKMARFVEKNNLIFFKTYSDLILEEFRPSENFSCQREEFIVSYFWKPENEKNIVISTETMERELLEVIKLFK